mgnify:CR=1 FL=1
MTDNNQNGARAAKISAAFPFPVGDYPLLLDALFNCSFHGFLIVTGDDRITFMNDSMLKLFGMDRVCPPATISELGRRATPDAATATAAQELWRRYLKATELPERIIQIVRGDGEKRWARFRIFRASPDYCIMCGEDITEQTLTENRFRALLDQSQDGIVLIDKDTGAFVEFNESAHRKLGYSRAEFARLTIPDIDVGESRADFVAHLRRIADQGADTFEARQKTKSGEIRNIHVVAQVISLAGKSYIQGVWRDITNLAVTEKHLRESEEKFRTLAEESPNMIFINQGGRIVYANRLCVELMGYSREELYAPDFDFMILVAPEFHAITRRNFKRHRAGRDVGTYEYEVVSKSGRRIAVFITTKLIHYAGANAILGIITDITELKQANASLEEAAAGLTSQAAALERKNAALQEVLAQIEDGKRRFGRRVRANAEKMILPVLTRLKRRANALAAKDLFLLETNLQNLTSEFAERIGNSSEVLSPRETEICGMIKSGMSSKEIAVQLSISSKTVDTLRNRIRKKLGLANQNVNLATFLQTLA